MKQLKTTDGYNTVRIPEELAKEIDEIVSSGDLGFRTRAEFVNEAIRLRIELLRLNNSTKPKKEPKGK